MFLLFDRTTVVRIDIVQVFFWRQFFYFTKKSDVNYWNYQCLSKLIWSRELWKGSLTLNLIISSQTDRVGLANIPLERNKQKNTRLELYKIMQFFFTVYELIYKWQIRIKNRWMCRVFLYEIMNYKFVQEFGIFLQTYKYLNMWR